MRRLVCLFSLVAVAIVFSAPAGATLIGDEVNARWQYPPGAFDENETFTVGAGAETTNWASSGGTLDFGVSSIVFTPGSTAFGLVLGVIWTFSSLDFNPQAVIASVAAITNWSGWSNSFISFTNNSITVNFANGITYGSVDRSLTLNITTRQTEIPEPTTMALLGAGAAGLIARRRRIV